MTQAKTTAPKKHTFNFENFMVGAGIFLLEILAPALITGGLLFWLASTINFWSMNHSTALSIFAVFFVLITLVLTVVAADVISRLQGKKSPRLRLVIMIIGGLIIPIGLFTAANLLYIRPGETYISRAISITLNQTTDVSMTQLGDTVKASTNPYTKIQGIDAINTIHSATSMEQLFAILNGDKTALTNVQVSNALSLAIASFGTQAKPDLIAVFQDHLATPQVANNLPEDLYTRYFAQSIAGLESEISTQTVNTQTRQAELQQIAGLAEQLKSEMDSVQSQSLQAANADPVLGFVLNTFLQMNITQDGDIYSLARTTASNTNLPDSVRGQALLLIAKLGTKDDTSLLYSYLQNSSETIKADAFTAITNLTLKLNPPKQ